MGYSENEASVRVDIFKPSGKWYLTEAVIVRPRSGHLIHDEFVAALKDHLDGRCQGMTAVVLESPNGYPIPFPLMVQIPEGA